MDNENQFAISKISAISKALKEKGFEPVKDFGFGYKPETDQYMIFFNLPYEASFHAILEQVPG